MTTFALMTDAELAAELRVAAESMTSLQNILEHRGWTVLVLMNRETHYTPLHRAALACDVQITRESSL